MRITIDGVLPAHVTAKDVILALIARIGIGGAVGHAVEYAGSTLRGMSMEGRMTICSMSIEAGARIGMIVPGRFQRLPRRPGHADYARVFLHDLRFDEHEQPRPGFILNQPAYKHTGILVTGADFGCGSSRESAAYATLDFGVRALIGTSFGDVYRGNCMQNGVLTIVLPQSVINGLFEQLQAAPDVIMTVDLAQQSVVAPDGTAHPFDIDATRKQRLLKGLDDVGVTLQQLAQIEAFETQYRANMPWLAHMI